MKDIKLLKIPLTHGSLLLVGETMQHNYEHHIPKTSRKIGPRALILPSWLQALYHRSLWFVNVFCNHLRMSFALGIAVKTLESNEDLQRKARPVGNAIKIGFSKK